MSCQGFDDKVGTFGIHLGYELFDGGRKRSVKREREAQLAQAKENLAKLTDEVELAVHTAYNRLERMQQMEERDLVRFYGAEYEAYKKHVPMLIPWRIRKYSSQQVPRPEPSR